MTSTPAPSSDPAGAARDRARLFASAALAMSLLVIVASISLRADADAFVDPAAVEYRIDINTAGQDELHLLPGVGPSLAQRIIDSRESEGPFAAPADLTRVSGIADRIAQRIAPHVRFE